MKRMSRVIVSFLLVLSLIFSTAVTSFAHPGRTDSSGGHHDYKNRSGLGDYHYHCGGYPAHLHKYGYCPYRDVFPKSVSLSVGKKTLYLGQSTKLKAKVSPSNSCDKDVDLTCSNWDVIEISGNKLIAVGYGTATITAKTFNGKKQKIKITVKKAKPEKVTISSSLEKDQTIYIGDSFQVSAKVTPKYVEDQSVEWASSKKKVATVDENGNVTALKAGEVTITATATNGVVGKKTFKIKEKKVKSVTVSEENLDLFLSDTYKLSATVKPADATHPEIAWSSSDPNIVEVFEDGSLVAKACGTATITATAKSGKTATVNVSVSEVIAERIEILTSTSFYLNEEANLAVQFYPENTSVKDIEWTSSNPSILAIDETGKLKCLSTGIATLTAIQKDVTASVDIEVKIKPVEQIEIQSSLRTANSMFVGKTMKLTATVHPADATYPDITWISSDPAVAIVDAYGKVTAISSGKVTISVKTADGFMQSHDIRVLPTFKSIFSGGNSSRKGLFSRK